MRMIFVHSAHYYYTIPDLELQHLLQLLQQLLNPLLQGA